MASAEPVFFTDSVRDTFVIDPAIILIVVGVVMFFITYCGCIGALRENVHLLKTVRICFTLLDKDCVFSVFETCVIPAFSSLQFSFSLTLLFLTQLIIAILGFFYANQVRGPFCLFRMITFECNMMQLIHIL